MTILSVSWGLGQQADSKPLPQPSADREAGCLRLGTLFLSPPKDAGAVGVGEPISRLGGPGGAVYKDALILKLRCLLLKGI